MHVPRRHPDRWAASRIPFAIGVVATLALQSAAARGQPAGEPIHLAYAGPAGCDDRAPLVREIARRAPTARLVDDADARRRFGVRIVREGASFVVDLEIRGDGDPVGRRFSTETCEQATRALALTIALSIDPAANSASMPPTPMPPAPPPPAPPPPIWTLGIGADADVLLMIASQPVGALGGHVELGRRNGATLRLSFRRSFQQTVSRAGLGANFDWTWGRLDGCPLRLGTTFELAPCASVELGEIDVAGFGGATGARRGRPWATAGLLARGSAHIRGFAASVDLGVAASINRESFTFQPSPEIYTIPALIPRAGISLGAEWSL